MTDLRAALRQLRVLPVLVLTELDLAAGIGQALVAGGLPAVEVTLRTDAAEEIIRAISSVPGLLVGAGTVLRVDQVHAAAEAGAQFVVSPGFSREVVRVCAELGLPVVPGVATATEVQMAIDQGLSLLKFFPAGVMGGPAALRALSGPFPTVEFLPTGGVTATTMTDYLAVDTVIAVGGSWMFPPDALAAGRLDTVQILAADAVERVGSGS